DRGRAALRHRIGHPVRTDRRRDRAVDPADAGAGLVCATLAGGRAQPGGGEGMSALRIAGVRVSFGKAEILRGVDLDVAAGETLVLFGPSGAGKTTLLRTIAGVEPAATGMVAIDASDISALAPEARNVGMAFQNFALYPHMPAFENIAS